MRSDPFAALLDVIDRRMSKFGPDRTAMWGYYYYDAALGVNAVRLDNGQIIPNPVALQNPTLYKRYPVVWMQNGHDVLVIPSRVISGSAFYSPTGYVEHFVVPLHVIWLWATVLAPDGSYTQCRFPVTPGETLDIYVGLHPGELGSSFYDGGWPDGGDGLFDPFSYGGYAGSGSSSIRRGATAVAVAAAPAGRGGHSGGTGGDPAGAPLVAPEPRDATGGQPGIGGAAGLATYPLWEADGNDGGLFVAGAAVPGSGQILLDSGSESGSLGGAVVDISSGNYISGPFGHWTLNVPYLGTLVLRSGAVTIPGGGNVFWAINDDGNINSGQGREMTAGSLAWGYGDPPGAGAIGGWPARAMATTDHTHDLFVYTQSTGIDYSFDWEIWSPLTAASSGGGGGYGGGGSGATVQYGETGLFVGWPFSIEFPANSGGGSSYAEPESIDVHYGQSGNYYGFVSLYWEI